MEQNFSQKQSSMRNDSSTVNKSKLSTPNFLNPLRLKHGTTMDVMEGGQKAARAAAPNTLEQAATVGESQVFTQRREMVRATKFWDLRREPLRTDSPELRAAERKTNVAIKDLVKHMMPDKQRLSERHLKSILGESPNLKSFETKQWLRKKANYYK